MVIVGGSYNCFATEVIRLTNGEWPPYLGKNVSHYGISSYIVTQAFALVGVKVVYGFFPWKRAFEAASIGKNWDGSVIWIRRPEREKLFDYGPAILEQEKVFFHLKDTPFSWQTVDDLKHFQIGGTIGYTYGESFDNAEKKGLLNVRRLVQDKQGLGMVLEKRLDIFPLEIDVANSLLAKEFQPQQIQQLTYYPKPLTRLNYHFILSKNISKQKRQHFLQLFNNGLNQLKQRIGEQWVLHPCSTPLTGNHGLTKEEVELYQSLCPSKLVQPSQPTSLD